MSSKTMVIGELAVKIKSADLAAQVIDTAIASDFEVEVTYSHTPGWQDPRIGGAMEDGEPEVEEEFSIEAIKVCANVPFSGDITDTIVRRGSDILPLLSGAQVGAIEDEILASIRKGGEL